MRLTLRLYTVIHNLTPIKIGIDIKIHKKGVIGEDESEMRLKRLKITKNSLIYSNLRLLLKFHAALQMGKRTQRGFKENQVVFVMIIRVFFGQWSGQIKLLPPSEARTRKVFPCVPRREGGGGTSSLGNHFRKLKRIFQSSIKSR